MPATTLAHGRHRGARQSNWRKDIGLDRDAQIVLARLLQPGNAMAGAGIVDEDGRCDLAHERVGGVQIAQVERFGTAVGLGGQFIKLVLAAGDGDDLPARLRERTHDGSADTTGSARYERWADRGAVHAEAPFSARAAFGSGTLDASRVAALRAASALRSAASSCSSTISRPSRVSMTSSSVTRPAVPP